MVLEILTDRSFEWSVQLNDGRSRKKQWPPKRSLHARLSWCYNI